VANFKRPAAKTRAEKLDAMYEILRSGDFRWLKNAMTRSLLSEEAGCTVSPEQFEQATVRFGKVEKIRLAHFEEDMSRVLPNWPILGRVVHRRHPLFANVTPDKLPRDIRDRLLRMNALDCNLLDACGGKP
jgi:hypothetical protein